MDLNDIVAFRKQYEEINERAENLFDALNNLEKKYSESQYRTEYEYDRFSFYGKDIELHGSYSWQGDWGETSREVSIEDFLNPEAYLQAREDKLKAAKEEKEERLKKEKTDKEKVEYEQFLKLKEKFEPK